MILLEGLFKFPIWSLIIFGNDETVEALAHNLHACSLGKYLLSAYSLTSLILGIEDRVLNRTQLLPARSLHPMGRSHVTTDYVVSQMSVRV